MAETNTSAVPNTELADAITSAVSPIQMAYPNLSDGPQVNSADMTPCAVPNIEIANVFLEPGQNVFNEPHRAVESEHRANQIDNCMMAVSQENHLVDFQNTASGVGGAGIPKGGEACCGSCPGVKYDPSKGSVTVRFVRDPDEGYMLEVKININTGSASDTPSHRVTLFIDHDNVQLVPPQHRAPNQKVGPYSQVDPSRSIYYRKIEEDSILVKELFGVEATALDLKKDVNHFVIPVYFDRDGKEPHPRGMSLFSNQSYGNDNWDDYTRNLRRMCNPGPDSNANDGISVFTLHLLTPSAQALTFMKNFIDDMNKPVKGWQERYEPRKGPNGEEASQQFALPTTTRNTGHLAHEDQDERVQARLLERVAAYQCRDVCLATIFQCGVAEYKADDDAPIGKSHRVQGFIFEVLGTKGTVHFALLTGRVGDDPAINYPDDTVFQFKTTDAADIEGVDNKSRAYVLPKLPGFGAPQHTYLKIVHGVEHTRTTVDGKAGPKTAVYSIPVWDGDVIPIDRQVDFEMMTEASSNSRKSSFFLQRVENKGHMKKVLTQISELGTAYNHQDSDNHTRAKAIVQQFTMNNLTISKELDFFGPLLANMPHRRADIEGCIEGAKGQLSDEQKVFLDKIRGVVNFFTVLAGPAGSGKTTTVMMALMVYFQFHDKDKPLTGLLLAPTNACADRLLVLAEEKIVSVCERSGKNPAEMPVIRLYPVENQKKTVKAEVGRNRLDQSAHPLHEQSAEELGCFGQASALVLSYLRKYKGRGGRIDIDRNHLSFKALERAGYVDAHLQLDGASPFKHPYADTQYAGILERLESYRDGTICDAQEQADLTADLMELFQDVLRSSPCVVSTVNSALQPFVTETLNPAWVVTDESSRVSDFDMMAGETARRLKRKSNAVHVLIADLMQIGPFITATNRKEPSLCPYQRRAGTATATRAIVTGHVTTMLRTTKRYVPWLVDHLLDKLMPRHLSAAFRPKASASRDLIDSSNRMMQQVGTKIPALWIDVKGRVHRNATHSKGNTDNVKATLSLLMDLVVCSDHGIDPSDMRLIVPYKLQKHEYADHISNFADSLRTAVLYDELFDDINPGKNVNLSRVANRIERFLMPTTVDSMQGDEAKLIIIDLTTTDSLGFMKLLARAWVLFSRARCMLIVIGDAEGQAIYESQNQLEHNIRVDSVVKKARCAFRRHSGMREHDPNKHPFVTRLVDRLNSGRPDQLVPGGRKATGDGVPLEEQLIQPEDEGDYYPSENAEEADGAGESGWGVDEHEATGDGVYEENSEWPSAANAPDAFGDTSGQDMVGESQSTVVSAWEPTPADNRDHTTTRATHVFHDSGGVNGKGVLRNSSSMKSKKGRKGGKNMAGGEDMLIEEDEEGNYMENY